ncbi:hypothetical protein ACLOJK_041745 [Asimina triloba]
MVELLAGPRSVMLVAARLHRDGFSGQPWLPDASAQICPAPPSFCLLSASVRPKATGFRLQQRLLVVDCHRRRGRRMLSAALATVLQVDEWTIGDLPIWILGEAGEGRIDMYFFFTNRSERSDRGSDGSWLSTRTGYD